VHPDKIAIYHTQFEVATGGYQANYHWESGSLQVEKDSRPGVVEGILPTRTQMTASPRRDVSQVGNWGGDTSAMSRKTSDGYKERCCHRSWGLQENMAEL
jgi:hypothetical protein